MSDGTVFEIQPHDRVLLVLVRKRILDDPSAKELADGVLTAAAQTPQIPVVLDLSQVRFAPSVALSSLVQLTNSFKFDQRQIMIIGLDRRLRETVRVTQLHRVLTIHDNLEQVLAQIDRDS